MEHYLEQLDLAEMMEKLDGLFARGSLDLPKLLEQIFAGNIKEAAGMVWQGLGSGRLWGLADMKGIFASILVLGILSVLVSGFLAGFENRRIAEIAHSIFYLLLLAILFKIFSNCLSVAGQTLEMTAQFSKFALPALCLSMGPAAGSMTAAGYYEMALLLIFVVEHFILRVCLPLLPVFMLLLLMNGVWEDGKLAAFMELLEKAIRSAAKVSLALVTGLGVLQSMVAPALDGLKRSAAQKAVAAIPGLGGLADSTTQLLLGSAVLLKNSLGVFVLLLLAALTFYPVLELFLYGAMLKLEGALVGVVADKRLTACILRTADAVFLSLRLVASSVACFFIMVAIITCLVGNG